MVFEIGICQGKELSEEQNDTIHYLFRETYVHYSRFMMNHMISSIVDLVKKLGKRIGAEGVETVEQLQYLTQAGCDIVQGYVFDKPLPQTEFEKRLCG